MVRSKRYLLAICILVTRSHLALAGNNLSTTSDVYKEDFSKGDYYGYSYNWGSGKPSAITLPPAIGTFPRQAKNPMTFHTGLRTVSGTIAPCPHLGYPNSTILLLGDGKKCKIVHFRHSTDDNFPRQNFNDQPSLVIDNIDCTDDSMLLPVYVTSDDAVDFVVLTPKNLDWDGGIARAVAYVTSGPTETPTYNFSDLTQAFQNAGVSVHGVGTPLGFGDIDGDGIMDVYAISASDNKQQLLLFLGTNASGRWNLKDNPLVVIDDIGFKTPIASSTRGATYGAACGAASVFRGPTSMKIFDYDIDGLADVVFVSPSDQNLRFFKGYGPAQFKFHHEIPFPAGGAQFITDGDPDHSWSQDLFVARGDHSCGTGNLGGYILPSQQASGYFRQSQLALPASSNSVIWYSTAYGYVYNKSNAVYGQTWDMIMGSRSNPSYVTAWFNLPTYDYYQTYSQAWSNAQNKGGQAIVNGTVLAPQSTPSGTSVTLEVSPDGGQNWEPLPLAEQGATANGHYFKNFGNAFQFHVLMKAPATTVSGSLSQSMPLSTTTPSLSSFTMNMTGLSQAANFSRSSLVGATIGTGVNQRALIFTAKFAYPGWDGHLVALDTKTGDTNTATSATASTSQSIWDAGTKLAQRSSSSRSIYTAYPSSHTVASGNFVVDSLSRINFTDQEVTSPTTPNNVPNLQQMLAVFPSVAATIVNQVRSGVAGLGVDNATKFKDTGHGDPVFVGPPTQAAETMGSGYSNFSSAQSSRSPFILKGSNAGMLHAFDASNGSELWAFVPTAQVRQTGLQVGYNPAAKSVNYSHKYLVDGPTSVSDVAYQGKWYTVAITGQGQGVADDQMGSYFALDITSPSAPKPLWQAFQPPVSGPLSCDYNNLCKQISCNQQMNVNSNCVLENQTFDSLFSISSNNRDEFGQPFGAVEAEDLELIFPAYGSNQGGWTTQSSTSSAKGSKAHSNSYIEAQGASSACNASSGQNAQSCARADYRFVVSTDAAGTYNILLRQWAQSQSSRIGILIDNTFVFGGSPSFFSYSENSWRWAKTVAVSLKAGKHTLSLVQYDNGVAIDIIQLKASANAAPSNGDSLTAVSNCDITPSPASCNTSCVANTDQEWVDCGVGAGLKCCANNGQSFCSPVGSSCSSPPEAMGQALSKPVIARVKGQTGDIWAAFFASGYNTGDGYNVGRTVYAVEAYSGTPLGHWNVPDVKAGSGIDLATSIPGSLALVDADNDGYVDRIYFGDTGGRLWKINTSATVSLQSDSMTSNYAMCQIFDAGDPNQSGQRVYAPIGMKPSVAVIAGTKPNIYFGTGGASLSSMDAKYKFYSLRDSDDMGACNTSKRTEASLQTSALEWVVSDSSAGYRFWGDPVIIDNAEIYWTSMWGDPDWLASADNSSNRTHLYARAVQDFVDQSGTKRSQGKSLLANAAAFLNVSGSVRAAPTLAANAKPVARGGQAIAGQSVANIYINNVAGDVMRLSSVGSKPQASGLRRMGWREIAL